MRTRVKICGLTRPEDAQMAVRLGADAIGLVFYPPSPRHVEVPQAQAIVKSLPPFVTVVALFVDEYPGLIAEVLKHLRVDLLQFHGDEPPEFCRLYDRPYIKAIGVQADADINAQAARYADAAGLLLDAYQPGTHGGTGSRFDWDLIPADCPLPVILAGGLDAGNVRQAIQQVRPYAVDVSSGVESGKGIKDTAKMAALLNEVYASDRQQ